MVMMTTMTPTPLDIEYYEWLIKKIDVPQDRSYRDLFERMHNFEFVWVVPNDDNRIQDALDIRLNFQDIAGKSLNLGGVTCLEMVISLSEGLAFLASGNSHSHQWAWTLIKNLGLSKFSDPVSPDQTRDIDHILHNLVFRMYNADGSGGFFPLQNPDGDQTKIEIWKQMNAYVTEMTDL